MGAGTEWPFICEFGNHHGTTMNGLRLSGEDHPVTVPSMSRERELVVGVNYSPLRFLGAVE